MRKLAFWEKLFLLFIYFLFVTGVSLLTSPLWRGMKIIGLPSWPLLYFIIMLIFVAIFLIVKYAEKKPFAHYGFKKFSGNEFILMLWFIALLMPLAFLGRIIDPGYDLWYANSTGLLTLSGLFFFTWTMPFFVIKEELIERAFMQNILRKYGFWWMTLAVAINFAFAHFFLPEKGLIHVIVWALSVLVGSLALIVFFELTRNLWLSILLHLFFNCLVGLQIFLHVKMPTWEIAFWVLMLLAGALSFKYAGPRFLQPFKAKFEKIGVAEIIFIVIFAVLLPLALLFA